MQSMDVLYLKYKMKQYNIYAGIGKKLTYQYTTLADSLADAEYEAYNIACFEYDSLRNLYNFPNESDIINEYCDEVRITVHDLTDSDFQKIDLKYKLTREDFINYHAILTEEDNVNKNNLIIGYVVESSNNISRTNC